MKLSLIALSSILALGVAAQDTTSSSSETAAPTHSATPEERCILNCDEDDTCCRAACVGVPCPSDQQANNTNICAAQCDQGDGSEADTQAYAECQARCITTTFFPGTATLTNSPTSTSTDSSATTTTSSASDDSSSDDSSDDATSSDDSNSDEATSTGSDDASSTDSADDEAPTDNAAMKLGGSAAGLAGLLVAAWVL